MKPKRLGRGLRGLIRNPETSDNPAPAVPQGGAAVKPKVVTPPVARPVRRPIPAPETQKQAPDTAPSAGPAAVGVPQERASSAGPSELPIAEIKANPFQPRKAFAEDDLADLKNSIAEHGVLQPVVVRRTGAGYELIAGERRLRAVKSLGRKLIPAIVREADDQQMQTLALVENLQRVDLNAIEKALALKAMMRNFGLTQEEVAARVGKARTSISNLIRLLDLPGVIQDLVGGGQLSGSQARALLLARGTERRLALAQRAVREGLTVRRIEKLATIERRTEVAKQEADPYVIDLQDRLRRALGTTVELRPKGGGGELRIAYHDADELDRLLERFGAE